MNRAFGYVLQNALETMEGADGQRIAAEIALTDDGCFVAVRISDTGPGIPEEALGKIRAAFYTTKGIKHAGLGLSATLRILEQMARAVEPPSLPPTSGWGGRWS